MTYICIYGSPYVFPKSFGTWLFMTSNYDTQCFHELFCFFAIFFLSLIRNSRVFLFDTQRFHDFIFIFESKRGHQTIDELESQDWLSTYYRLSQNKMKKASFFCTFFFVKSKGFFFLVNFGYFTWVFLVKSKQIFFSC